MRLISWNRLLRKNCRVEHATKFAFLFRRIQVFLLIDTSAFLGKKPVSQEVELGENPTTFSATPIKKRCRLSCPTLWRFHAEYSAFYSLASLHFHRNLRKSFIRDCVLLPYTLYTASKTNDALSFGTRFRLYILIGSGWSVLSCFHRNRLNCRSLISQKKDSIQINRCRFPFAFSDYLCCLLRKTIWLSTRKRFAFLWASLFVTIRYHKFLRDTRGNTV